MWVIYAAALLLADYLDSHIAGDLTLPSFFLVPFLGGVLAAFFWRPLRPTIGQCALMTLLITLIGIAGSAVVLHEGVVCLLIVSPLLYAFILTGALLGRLWFRRDPSLLRLSILPLLALVTLAEPFTRSSRDAVSTDELVIHAPPDRVWQEVVAFPDIPTPARFWLFRLGLPYPMSTTSEGGFVGAHRRCIFSGGAVFEETVAEFEPSHKLTFEIVESPPDPELINHLTPARGQFELRDLGHGSTLLLGRTWYSLHVRPLWYFDAWTQHIFHAVHRRVMEDVRVRAEAPPRL